MASSFFVKLNANYFHDVAIASLDDRHEVMFTRGIALCRAMGTDGFIPTVKLVDCTRGATQAKAIRIARDLCKNHGDFRGPLEEVPGGFRFRNWDTEQRALVELEARRKADRVRQQRKRDRDRATTADTPETVSRDTSRDVTHTEVEVEVEAAAAATQRGGSGVALTPDLEILRRRFEEYTDTETISWAHLKPAQATAISELIARHGDDRLLEVARRAGRRIGLVQGLLPAWADLKGPRLIQASTDPDAHVMCGRCGALKSQHASEDDDHPWRRERSA